MTINKPGVAIMKSISKVDGLQRSYLVTSLVLTLVIFSCAATASADALSLEGQRPNLILIMTDDQGYWDTGATGNNAIDTPNMDRLAEEGMQLERYYAAPVCAPTRAGLMTGRHYLRTGLYNTRFGGDTLGKDEITVAQLLQGGGYRTGLFGKWHLGKYPGYQPQDRGFNEFFGHYHGHIERYEFPDQVHRNGRPVKARGYVSDLFTDAAIDFIDQSLQKSQPFFCSLMFNAPHSPWLLDTSHYGQPDGDKQLSKYLDMGLPIREARIYALIERVDDNVGRLLDHLDREGLAHNTMVVFTSDNGGVSKYWKGGMNGYKSSTYEGGVRAPCFVRWPAQIQPGSRTDSLTSHIDWLPTFCELSGIPSPKDRKIDGKSLVKLLTQNPKAKHHSFVYHTWDRYSPNPDRRWGISDGTWKLLCVVGNQATASEANWRLFNLTEDPGEAKNLKAKHPEIVERLRQEFSEWFDDVTNGITYQPVRIPISPRVDSVSELSPSWAKWKGDHIQYTFDGYDWDTIDHWKKPDESATWRLNVAQSGDYEIKLTYGCRPIDAGGTLRLAVGEHSITHKIQPTATAEQFEDFIVGQLHLNSGESEFIASVISTTGDELMRLNSISLRRLTANSR